MEVTKSLGYDDTMSRDGNPIDFNELSVTLEETARDGFDTTKTNESYT